MPSLARAAIVESKARGRDPTHGDRLAVLRPDLPQTPTDLLASSAAAGGLIVDVGVLAVAAGGELAGNAGRRQGGWRTAVAEAFA